MVYKEMSRLLLVLALLLCPVCAFGENMDPDDDESQYAWSENRGWINFQPSWGPGVTVSDFDVTGKAWGENIGWVNMNPTGSGVVNDGDGNLSGYAWAENAGWINFSPADGGVYIDSCGDFNGTAWGENIGWIIFRSEGEYPFKVTTAWESPVDMEPPETEPDSPLQDWYTEDVDITLTATDCGSAVSEVHYTLDGGEEVVEEDSTTTFSIMGEGEHTLTYYSIDEEGNIEASTEVTISIDKTPPEITIIKPVDGEPYFINNVVLADYTVTETGSGIATLTATANDGESVDTTTIATYEFTVSASDVAGNLSSVTHTYEVIFAGNMDPFHNASQYAWSENRGWINFQPSWGPGVTVSDFDVTGKAWGENIGWVNMNPTGSGVVNDGDGNLSGYAWAENAGWISFSCENTASCTTVDYGVTIDTTTGEFSGRAWGENIGWIIFRGEGTISFRMVTSWEPSVINDCEFDSNGDGDVDGLDFAWWVDKLDEETLPKFAPEFGRINCLD